MARTLLATAALSALVLAASAAWAEPLPSFPRHTAYTKARDSLIASGWKPAEPPPTQYDRCLEGDARCQGRPETVICRGTGRAACDFLWTKNGTVAKVIATGEEEPIIVRHVECASGCR